MYFKEKDETEYSINILPMIDIIFAILSFFIISSLYLTKIDTIKVNLPKSSTAVREQNKPQIITIDNNENIYFNSREISLTNMSSIIRTNIENLEEPIVILRADTSVKHGFIVNLLDELRKIENLKIGISTEKQLSGL
jgi:biopolymer transport protein ExbD